jgi:hypothetical protein
MDQPNAPQLTDDYVNEQPLYVEAAIWAACIAIPLFAGYLFASAIGKFSQRKAAPAAAGPSREQVQVTVITREGSSPQPEPQPIPAVDQLAVNPAPGSGQLVLRPLQVTPSTPLTSPNGTQTPGQRKESTDEPVLPNHPLQPVSVGLSPSPEGEVLLESNSINGPASPLGGSDLVQRDSNATPGVVLASPGATSDNKPVSPPVISPLPNLQLAEISVGRRPVQLRRYALAQNDVRQIAALILTEVLTQCVSSSWLDDHPDDTASLEALLIQYNVEQYRPGTWMHTADILLQLEYDNLLVKVKEVAQAFTGETGIPILRIDPSLSFKRDNGKGVIDFGLTAAVISTDEAHLTEAPPETEPVKLPPLGTWQFAPTHLGEQELYLASCHEFLARVLQAVDHLVSITGKTVASIILHPSEPNDDGDKGVTVIYQPELKLGSPLEVAPAPSPSAKDEPNQETLICS